MQFDFAEIRRCYISGEIADTDECREHFLNAETLLKRKGYDPVNPKKEKVSFSDAGCGSIFMLTDWENSERARMEQAEAQKMGLLIGYEKDVLRFEEKYGNGAFSVCRIQ